jgi:hypothetical protein
MGQSVNKRCYRAKLHDVPVNKRTWRRNVLAGVRHQTGIPVAADRCKRSKRRDSDLQREYRDDCFRHQTDKICAKSRAQPNEG